MKLFVKKDCNKCNYLKPYLTDKVEIFDIETSEGLGELAYYNLIPVAEKILPILVDDNEVVYTEAILIKKQLEKQ